YQNFLQIASERFVTLALFYRANPSHLFDSKQTVCYTCTPPMSRNHKKKSHPPVTISSKSLSQGERRFHIPNQVHDRLQESAAAMNDNIQHKRDITSGIDRRRKVLSGRSA